MASRRPSAIRRLLSRLILLGLAAVAVALARDWAIRHNDARAGTTSGGQPIG